MKVAYKIYVKGLVQGVGFRYFTSKKATALKIVGDVINLEDGSVLINAYGEERNMIKFLDWCHYGPESANVEQLEYYLQIYEDLESFEILR